MLLEVVECHHQDAAQFVIMGYVSQ